MNFTTKQNLPFGIIVEPIHADEAVTTLDVDALRQLFRQHQLIVLRGFKTFSSAEGFANYCETWGEISLWPFGKVLELIEQKNPEDHIFDHNYVPLHWDGMYRPQVPEYQIFHCVVAPGLNDGGRTTFSNTKLVVDRASRRVRESWANITGSYQRKMEFYHSKTIAPLITKHPTRDFSVIRYCESPQADDANFVNHPDIKFTGVGSDAAIDFRNSLNAALYAPENFYAHTWQNGDIVIADNYTLLHGREAFTSGAPRHLRRVHVLGSPALNNPHLVFHK